MRRQSTGASFPGLPCRAGNSNRFRDLAIGAGIPLAKFSEIGSPKQNTKQRVSSPVTSDRRIGGRKGSRCPSAGRETQEGSMRTIRARALTLASAAILSGAAFSGAHAQSNELTLCWAAWDPANALVELSKDFTAETGIDMKFEFVPWTSYRRPLPQRAQLAGHALRPDHRRQPVDRRLGRERPLRQAERLLRQGRHLDG